MSRKVLLIEPNYKNKYPPMGLMKISTYYKRLGDDVRFFKGNLIDLVLDDIYEETLETLNHIDDTIVWGKYKTDIIDYIRKGKKASLDKLVLLSFEHKALVKDKLERSRKYFRNKDYFKLENRKYDRVGITTLFTFCWDITIKTIEFAKKLCKTEEGVMVGGVMASILPKEIEEATGIKPFVGTLSHIGDLDDDNDMIIDSLPLDYSILYEIDYEYPAKDAYFGYMTRGCINKCGFCAVPKLEPNYCEFIGIKEQIERTNKQFGGKKDLLLLDNNVLASKSFNQIIDEIKACGFEKGSKYNAPNEFEVSMKNLEDGYNDRAYIKYIVKLYNDLINKLNNNTSRYNITYDDFNDMKQYLEDNNLLSADTATKESIINAYDYMSKFFGLVHKKSSKMRIVDFNQGIDSRLVNDDNMKKLSEIAIKPLRIAFDHWELRDIYENAVKTAVRNGITNLSNYLLYNYKDKPIELYYRLQLNVQLCDELGASIYSFPMKYHPIDDPQYFKNRDYIGTHWNRKFIRTIQAVLNSTKGKIGRGKSFFEEAFGSNEEEFYDILYMPEAFIIYRMFFKEIGLTQKWKETFHGLQSDKLEIAKKIIETNRFVDINASIYDEEILELLKFYTISRDDAVNMMHNKFKSN